MKARDVMSRNAECISTQDSLETAAKRLADAGVGAMPICGEDDRLKGMLTDRDIVVKAIAKGKDLARTMAGDLAEGKPVTIGADDSIRETLRTMRRAQVRRLPVIDGYRLVGIVSQADVARQLSHRRSGRLLEDVSEPSHGWRGVRMVPILLGTAAVGYVLLQRMGARRASITADTVVHVPVDAAYNQWTQFEEFPAFMHGVEEVRQIDDTHLHWRARVAGKERQWDAHIHEQEPNKKIAWRATSGTRNDGVVRFEPVGPTSTRVEVEMAIEPDTFGERVGSAMGLPSRQVKADLERFRELIERRDGVPTGAWRGSV
jgi:CBS domain-containing protein